MYGQRPCFIFSMPDGCFDKLHGVLQISIMVNHVPYGGSVTVDRYCGTVTDTFTISSEVRRSRTIWNGDLGTRFENVGSMRWYLQGWVDPDTGTTPSLMYQFSIDAGPSAGTVVLKDWSHETCFSVSANQTCWSSSNSRTVSELSPAFRDRDVE